MKNYYEIDNTWESFLVKTREEFESKFVFTGNFHSSVPKIIKEGYQTAEFIMAHSHFHLPMYNEALNKLYILFEIAIKIRCEELDVKLDFVDKNGKVKNKTLDRLITDLCEKDLFTVNEYELKDIKEIRNISLHTDVYKNLGGLSANRVIATVNTLNKIFVSKELKLDWEQQLNETIKTFVGFKNSLFIIPYKNQKVLSYSGIPVIARKIKEEWVHVWIFKPVLENTETLLKNKKRVKPIILILKDEIINSKGFKAIDFLTNDFLEFEFTDEPQNIKKLEDFNDAFKNATPYEKLSFESSQENEVPYFLTKFIYQYTWCF